MFFYPWPWWYHTLRHTGGTSIAFSWLIILGVLLGFLWIGFSETGSRSADSPKDRTYPDRTNALIYALGGGLLCSRLAFVGLHLSYYQDHPMEIIAFWQGGLSASAGMLGTLLGLLLFTWPTRRFFWCILDDLSLPGLIFALTAWVGTWLEGVAYGRPVALDWSWLTRSDPFFGQVARWPTQLLGVLLSLFAFLAFLRLKPGWPQGARGALAWSLIALILALVGFFRADPSMLLLGTRLDVLAPGTLAILGLGITASRWRTPRE